MKSLTPKQRKVLNFLRTFNAEHGYAPSIKEIGEEFGLSSPASVHQHLKALAEKGYISREWNRKRDLVILEPETPQASEMDLPLLGLIAAGEPIEAILGEETVPAPSSMIASRGKHYALKVSGNSMIEDHVLDGDIIVVRSAESAENGQTVVALVDNEGATLKRYYREGASIRLQPANETMDPIMAPEDKVRVQGILVGLIRAY